MFLTLYLNIYVCKDKYFENVYSFQAGTIAGSPDFNIVTSESIISSENKNQFQQPQNQSISIPEQAKSIQDFR